MYTTACHSVQSRAPRFLTPGPRLLSAGGVEQMLRRFRLPSYRAIRFWLEDYRSRMRIVNLWDSVFGGVPEELALYARAGGMVDATELEIAFLNRVDDELFPIDMEYADSLYNDGGSVIEACVPIAGYGIAWEMEELGHLRDAIVLVLITALQSEVLDPPEEAYWRIGDEDTFDDEVLSYCLACNVEPPAWRLPQSWDGIREFRAALRALPAPFDGLADVLDVLIKATGNIFLDSVDMFWQAEYDGAYDFQYCWCQDCIADLKKMHEQARPAVDRIHALYDWCDHNPAVARARVLALLAAAAGGEPVPEVQP